MLLVSILLVMRNGFTQGVLVFFFNIYEETLLDSDWLQKPLNARNKEEAHWDAVHRQ